MTDRFWCELAVINGRVEHGVSIDVVDGRFQSIVAGTAPAADTRQLSGLSVAGFANAHSHAFHRALRAQTQADRGTFWTWRELMYRAAERLDPGNYHRLARAVFAEMVCAGISCVGEFHYVHHNRDGTPYAERNAMGEAVLQAARDAGLRITLLDALYLHGSLGADGYQRPAGAQVRYADASPEAWIDRVDSIAGGDGHRVGGAIHSVRAVDPDAMSVVAEWCRSTGAPLHAHVSEQQAENEACVGHHGCTPVELLDRAGALGPGFTAVHATHLTTDDIERLGRSGSWVCMCPTTERDLGDGIGPSVALASAGVPISLGSDSHAEIDFCVEMRAVEHHQRLASRERGLHSASELLHMATATGHAGLGWDDAGAIAVGNRADLTTIDLGSVRTAGAPDELAIENVVFAATAGDVTTVVIDGGVVVEGGRHVQFDVASELATATRGLFA